MDLISQSESDLSETSLYSESFIDETLSYSSQSDLSSIETKKEIKFGEASSLLFKENEKFADQNRKSKNQKKKRENEDRKKNQETKSIKEMDIKLRSDKELKQFRPLTTSKDLTKTDLRRIKSSVGIDIKVLSNTQNNQKIDIAKNFDYLIKKTSILKSNLNDYTIDVGEINKSKSSKINITVDTSKARSNTEVLKLCLAELGWLECPNGHPNGCDIIWQSCASHEGRDQSSHSYFSSDSRLNKFPCMNHLLKKGPLTHSLNMMRRFYPNEYDFYPRTWFLPEQLKEFTQECHFIHDQDSKMKIPLTTFIVKPNDGSQGDGIYLINSPSGYLNPKTDNPKSFIVQEYVHNPFLIDGLKSDFRIYVVILNIKPLEIYIYDEGLVRFATVDYEKPDTNNLNQIYMHLTNYSLNKKNEKYQFSKEKINDEKLAGQGSKRKLTKIYSYMSKIGINVTKIKNEIDDLIIKTVFALLPEIKVELSYDIYNSPNKQRPSSFQIIGFDILLKEDLKPVLLEVNCNPSLRIDFESETSDGRTVSLASPIDVEIKKPLILETLRLACPKKKLDLMEKFKKEQEQAEKASLYRKYLVKQRIERRSISSIKYKKINFDKIPLLSKPSQSYIKKQRSINFEQLENISDNRENCTHNTTIKSFINRTKTSNSSSLSENYLRNIFPNINLRNQYNQFYLYENIADLFIFFTINNTFKLMTHDDFRLFVKYCYLINKSVSSDNLDIIFFELSKKWEMYNTKQKYYDSNQNPVIGLCYQGFFECFTKLSRMIFNEPTLEQSVKLLVYYCKLFLVQRGFKSNQFFSLNLNKIETSVLINKIDSLNLREKTENHEHTNLYSKNKKSIFPIFFDSTA